MISKLRTAAFLVCIVTATIGATEASAASIGVAAGKPTQDGKRTALVSYRDLNLAVPAGQTALRKRIQQAAKLVCPSLGSSTFDLAVESCRRDARVGARSQMLAAIERATGEQLASASDPASAR